MKIKGWMFRIIGIFFLMAVTGCHQIQEVPIETLKEAVIGSEELSWVEGSVKDLRRLIGLNPREVEDFVYYKPASSMEVEELLIIKVKDYQQFDELELLIEQRVATQVNRFESYKPENCGLLENYELKMKGDYLFFMVSKEVDEFSDRFKEAF